MSDRWKTEGIVAVEAYQSAAGGNSPTGPMEAVLRALGIPPDLPAGTVRECLLIVADLVRADYSGLVKAQAEALRRLVP